MFIYFTPTFDSTGIHGPYQTKLLNKPMLTSTGEHMNKPVIELVFPYNRRKVWNFSKLIYSSSVHPTKAKFNSSYTLCYSLPGLEEFFKRLHPVVATKRWICNTKGRHLRERNYRDILFIVIIIRRQRNQCIEIHL